ncbi:hypothetical protein EJB05_40401, partial [Eragrostis curvula]
MARRRHDPSPAPPPPPPPPPPQESSPDEVSDTEGEEPPRAVTAQLPPQNPEAYHPATAADDADSSEEEESDSDAEAHSFQIQPVTRSSTKPAAAAPQPESDDDAEEEDGESTELEPEVPEPMQKKAAAAAARKRPALEAAVSGKSKKAKAEVGKAAVEVTPTGKAKKANAESEKLAPEPTSSGKPEKPGVKTKKLGRSPRTWSKEDWTKILAALAAHVKSEGALPKTAVLIAAVRDRLDRKECNYTDMYEAVRRLKARYEKSVKTAVVPNAEDELQMYNLSEAIWGEKAKEAIAAAASQNDANVTKSKKRQAKKEKMDGISKGGTLKVTNENGDTQKGSKKGQANKKKTDRGQNSMEEETHEEETEREPMVLRSFDELQNLYPNLAGCVGMIEAQHPCGEVLKRAFEFIGDEKASALESKIKKHKILEVKVQMGRGDIRKEVLNLVIGMSG